MKTYLALVLPLVLIACGSGSDDLLDTSATTDDNQLSTQLSATEQSEVDYDLLKAAYADGKVWSCQLVRLASQNRDDIDAYTGGLEWTFSYDPESSTIVGYTLNGITYNYNPWVFVRQTQYIEERENEYYKIVWSLGKDPFPQWFGEVPEFKFRVTDAGYILGIKESTVPSTSDNDIFCSTYNYSEALVSDTLISTIEAANP